MSTSLFSSKISCTRIRNPFGCLHDVKYIRDVSLLPKISKPFHPRKLELADQDFCQVVQVHEASTYDSLLIKSRAPSSTTVHHSQTSCMTMKSDIKLYCRHIFNIIISKPMSKDLSGDSSRRDSIDCFFKSGQKNHFLWRSWTGLQTYLHPHKSTSSNHEGCHIEEPIP